MAALVNLSAQQWPDLFDALSVLQTDVRMADQGVRGVLCQRPDGAILFGIYPLRQAPTPQVVYWILPIVQTDPRDGGPDFSAVSIDRRAADLLADFRTNPYFLREVRRINTADKGYDH